MKEASEVVDNAYHIPVLLNECCDYLSIKRDGLYVDCTLGGGGHTKEIIKRGGRVIGLDQDPDSIAKTSRELAEYISTERLEIIQTNFRFIEQAVSSAKLAHGQPVDGILMDLGISSHQIDEPSRGFAFGADGPLDMRMGQGVTANGDAGEFTAATIVNDWTVEDIADTLYHFGEETRSRQIAREIVLARPIRTTGELEKVISRVTSWKQRSKTLAKCFQALRICVNDEMGALDEALMSAHKCLRPGGRLVVISYHSLEDRRVKRLFKTGSVDGDDDSGSSSGPWNPLFKRAKPPTDEEIERNRRARSAKLRVAERYDASNRYTQLADNPALRRSLVGAKQLAKLAKKKQLEELLDDDDDGEKEEGDDTPKR